MQREAARWAKAEFLIQQAMSKKKSAQKKIVSKKLNGNQPLVVINITFAKESNPVSNGISFILGYLIVKVFDLLLAYWFPELFH